MHIPAIPFPFHGPAGHVDPLGLLPLFLGFSGPLSSSFLIVLPMGLLAVIPAMLAHWTCYLFLLGFLGPLISSLPLILPIGPLAIIAAMLAHWACYLFSWAT